MTVAAAMNEALAHYNSGRLAPALQLASQIVAARPLRADAHNLVGAILSAKGDRDGAAAAFAEAARLDPGNALFHANLGEAERQRGRLDAALAALTRAVALDPRSAQAFNNLGIVRFERREFEEAVACYQTAIAAEATYPEAHNNLGNALRALGRDDAAAEAYQQALLLREDYAEAYNNLAALLRDSDKPEEAEHCYRRAIELRPGYLDPYGNLAGLLVDANRADEALRVLGEALRIDENHVPTLVNVARTQLGLGNHAQAEQACRLALARDPANADAELALGEVLQELDRFPEALAAFERATRRDPDAADAHNHYGICLKSVGRLDEARRELLRALELDPHAYGCYANLGDLERFTADSPRLKAMEAILAGAAEPESPRYLALHFALGKAYDDLGDYEKAIRHFKIGAKVKRQRLRYDEAETVGFFDAIRATFDRALFESRPFAGNPSRLPVFIIGMPRSGSTLVEQILSSHPRVFGAGETKEFSRRLGALRGRFPALPKYPGLVARMRPEHFAMLADGYLGALAAGAPGAARATDKLLTNYYFVGLLHLLFPNARFINTRRNPVDTCWSAFTKLFKDDMPHSYDFGELARYYRKYEELMDHWQAVLPAGTIHVVDYERVVEDVESAARALIDFVGLPWDPACLAFHESSRPVKTASVVQVRKPVYRSSVERWRRYGAEIQPLAEALGYGGAPARP
jgi:tetratricopeptide (TPR) repeat protein